ncbi:MAG: hypothetical protein KDA64_13925, partial [Rhodospirillaceae bacterium]|nr:hypothetical protein [Rhodospirillaceae bacterium]
MVTQLGSALEDGLQKWGDVVATAGWGQLHVQSIDFETKTGRVIVEDPWELTIYRTDDLANNLPFLCGKLSGIFTHAYGRTMRAKVIDILDVGNWPQAVIDLAPSDATLLSELEELMRRDGFTRQERLQFANRQLRERTQELARANSLLTIARNDADTLRKVAEEANAAKSRLIASMSHELRTPLNAILGFSEIIRDQIFGAGANDRYRDYAEDIYNSGTHLLELIGDLLDLAKV